MTWALKIDAVWEMFSELTVTPYPSPVRTDVSSTTGALPSTRNPKRAGSPTAGFRLKTGTGNVATGFSKLSGKRILTMATPNAVFAGHSFVYPFASV